MFRPAALFFSASEPKMPASEQDHAVDAEQAADDPADVQQVGRSVHGRLLDEDDVQDHGYREDDDGEHSGALPPGAVAVGLGQVHLGHPPHQAL